MPTMMLDTGLLTNTFDTCCYRGTAEAEAVARGLLWIATKRLLPRSQAFKHADELHHAAVEFQILMNRSPGKPVADDPVCQAHLRTMMRCYEPLIDDLIIVGAFENIIKAHLLLAGVAVHMVSRNAKRVVGISREQQKTTPVPIRTIMAAEPAKDCLHLLTDKTLTITQIIADAYILAATINPAVALAIRELVGRRNRIHYSPSMVWWTPPSDTLRFLMLRNYVDGPIQEVQNRLDRVTSCA